MRESDASPSTADRLRKARGKNGSGRVPTDLKPDDFYGYMIEHRYIFAPTGEVWPASSVDARLSVVGNIKASTWIDQNRAVEQMTWSPGQPAVIDNRLITQGGWFERKGCRVFNLYRPPLVKPIAGNADRWLHHIDRLYGADIGSSYQRQGLKLSKHFKL